MIRPHTHSDWLPDQQCAVCGRHSRLIASILGVCSKCVRQWPAKARPHLEAAHAQTRRDFRMTVHPPRAEGGVNCPLCAHQCVMGEGEMGYCGLRMVRGGRLRHLAGTPDRGLLHWYRDPLPTNCVAMWVCGGRNQPGCHNLAVFYGSCTLNCLYCQNWHYRDMLPTDAQIDADRRAARPAKRGVSAAELAAAATARTFCVCFFGGDPASQMPHALASATLLAKQGVTICWETSGAANPRLMARAVDLSLRSNGTVKFELKAYNERLHLSLTGVSNHQALENLTEAAQRFSERPDPPLVMVSTLLVPGYVDAEEVRQIARFVAGFSPHIPYTLLGFAPAFYMPDLPRTSVHHAEEAEEVALEAGLTRVRIGNRHLLSRDY